MVKTLSGTPSRPRRAALYLRISTGSQFTDNQRPDVEQLVQARGLDVVEIYEENVSAAAKVRPKRKYEPAAQEGPQVPEGA